MQGGDCGFACCDEMWLEILVSRLLPPGVDELPNVFGPHADVRFSQQTRRGCVFPIRSKHLIKAFISPHLFSLAQAAKVYREDLRFRLLGESFHFARFDRLTLAGTMEKDCKTL